jgi:hypothetical protein
MAIDKIQSESINLADNFAFTGTVTGAGESNLPLFHVNCSGNQSVSDNTNTKITNWGTPTIDTASGWDSSNNKYTIQTAGKYLIYATFSPFDTSANGVLREATLTVYKNGSSMVADGIGFTGDCTALNPKVHFTTTLAQNDYIELYGIHNTAGSSPLFHCSNDKSHWTIMFITS